MKDTTITRLQEMGASRWTKNDHDRLYLNEAAFYLIGLEVKRYNTGNISSASLNGSDISNSEAKRILAALGNPYINLKTGRLALVNHTHHASQSLKSAIEAI